MSKTLNEIAKELQNENKKINLIYAFNGSGKTRLSKEFQNLISQKNNQPEDSGFKNKKILYYSAFTEDLFFWDNDLNKNLEHTLNIQPNQFTDWILREQGKEKNIIDNFQRYTNNKLTPKFNENYSQVTFSFERGNDVKEDNIKISKGEESCFIWSIFYSLFEQVISVLNIAEPEERDTQDFNELEYIFIDDPVSSLDENHLIELAVNISSLIKDSESNLGFIITTHNPLFYNILYNELSRLKRCGNFRLEKMEDNTHNLWKQNNDSPFAYQVHLIDKLESIFKQEIQIKEFLKEIKHEYKNKVESILKKELNDNELSEFYRLINNLKINNSFYIRKNYVNNKGNKDNKGHSFTLSLFKEKEIKECEVEKYHFNLIRNILEKLATFLGYRDMKDVLPQDGSGPDPYMNRIVNLSSHSKHSGEETILISDNDKIVLKGLIQHLTKEYKFRSKFIKLGDTI